MLTITKQSDTRVDIEVSGLLEAETMRVGLEELIEKSEGVTNGTMLYRIPAFTMPTPAAIGVEIGLLPKLFSLIGKYKKCAVLSDAAWLRTAAEIEGALFPGIDIKAFTLSQEDDAEAWLRGTVDA